MKVALITGITGQDGSYLADFLLAKEYFVYGIIRRSSNFNTQRIDHIYNHPRLHLFYGDLTDSTNLTSILSKIKTKHKLGDAIKVFEVYNLGAQSFVKASFEIPEYTLDANCLGTCRLLEAIRANGLDKVARFYQASSSEMFGQVQQVPQTEKTPFYPRSPYGVSKVAAFWIVVNYRESYGIHASNGILYNHESPKRGGTFVTRKITRGINSILQGKMEYLTLGNLDAKRDWGHSQDYVRGMWLMLQQSKPDDYILAMGEQYSVRQFAEKAFAHVGIQLKWQGQGLKEIGYDAKTNKTLIRVDPKYFRPCEVESLLGDPTKARTKLGWTPKFTFDDLVKDMVDSDVNLNG